MTTSPPADAAPNLARAAGVILAGGRGARLGETDKAALVLGDDSFLQRSLDACRGLARVIVVGAPAVVTAAAREPLPANVLQTREEPPGGGPAAGLAAGLTALSDRPDISALVVIAVDMPGVTAVTVERLLAGLVGVEAAWLCGPDGRRQLAVALDRAALTSAIEEHTVDGHTVDGLAMHRLLTRLRAVELPGSAAELLDVDSWTDLHRARAMHESVKRESARLD